MGKISFLSATDISGAEWKCLSDVSPVTTWFQTIEAYEFYSKLPEIFEAFAYGVEENGRLEGVLVGYVTKETNALKQLVSRRAIVIGGPLLAENISDDALKTLLFGVADVLKHKVIYIETRNLNDYGKWKTVFETASWEYEPHLNFHVDTSSEQFFLENIGRSRKREIKLSVANSMEVDYDPSIDDVHVFYAILSKLYKVKVKTPLFPFSFFDTLYGMPSSQFIVVKHDGKVVGGALNICFKGVVYGWFLCGEHGGARHIYPATMADFAGMQFAARNGYYRYDLMGAGKPDEEYGVRKFKAEFGGKLIEHGRFKYICSPLLYKIGCLGVKILKNL